MMAATPPGFVSPVSCKHSQNRMDWKMTGFARQEPMRMRICAITLLAAVLALPLFAAQQESLGDFARRMQQERSKSAPKTIKAYTNDNLPASSSSGSRAVASGTDSASSSEKTESEVSPARTTDNPGTSGADKGTKEYWQGRFKSARAELARAKELQQLAEDELSLLQIQDARLLDLPSKASLAEKIEAKQDEVSKSQTATAQAEKTLEDLQDEFKDSGAPDEWSNAEPSE